MTSIMQQHAIRCDYCGETLCHWSRHSEAIADIRAYARTQKPGLDAFYANEHQFRN